MKINKYKIDFTKVKSFHDIKVILSHLNIEFAFEVGNLPTKLKEYVIYIETVELKDESQESIQPESIVSTETGTDE